MLTAWQPSCDGIKMDVRHGRTYPAARAGSWGVWVVWRMTCAVHPVRHTGQTVDSLPMCSLQAGAADLSMEFSPLDMIWLLQGSLLWFCRGRPSGLCLGTSAGFMV